MTVNSPTEEEKVRIFERIKREMDIFWKGEYTRFQASTCVANELGKWAGASDKEKGKAFDSYLAEINSILAIQDEDQSATRGTSLPSGAPLPSERRPNAKQIRDEVEDLLDQVSREELEGEDPEPRTTRKRAREEDMPWYSSNLSSARSSVAEVRFSPVLCHFC